MQTRRVEWIAIAAALVAIHALLVSLSGEFAYDAPLSSYPVVDLVILEMAAGGFYLILLWLVPRSRPEPGLLALVICVGLALRVMTMASEPILEDDYYRYLWDGAVVAGGMDPYRYSPADVLGTEGGGQPASDLSRLSMLAEASRPVAQRVNYPQLTTVYPPLAQGVFAVAAVAEPFSLTAWRMTSLLFEGATLVLLYSILVSLGRSPLWLAVYWWNPLVVKELVNSAHMDVLLLPLLCGVLLSMLQGKLRLASACLALAAGVKLWPALLLPIVLRPLSTRPRRLASAVIVFSLIFAVTMAWLVRQASIDSGLVAYAGGWNMNDALFLALDALIDTALTAIDYPWIESESVARAFVAATLVWFGLWFNRHEARDGDELCRRFLYLTAAVFLLSPTQFPWYFTWLVPFLVVAPSPALALLTALLPLYYLRFHFDFRGEPRIFDYGVVWFEYLPVWLLLAREWLLRDRLGARARVGLGQP